MIAMMLAAAAAFVCETPTIHDGDNIRCGRVTMRLARIDAPDFATSPKCRRVTTSATCDDRQAERSRDHLRHLIEGRVVTCVVVDASPTAHGFQARDRYGRPVVRCQVNGRDLSEMQLRAGMAKAWP